MREKIGFGIVDFCNFDSLVTLILTFDDLEAYIVRFVSPTFIHSTIDHVAALSSIVNGRTDIIRSSQKRNDLKMHSIQRRAFTRTPEL